MKRDLKSILTIGFSLALIVLTFMWKMEAKDAVMPLTFMIVWYYFNKNQTTQQAQPSSTNPL
jgi:hypothetical protein